MISSRLPTLSDEGIIILKKIPPKQYGAPNAPKFDFKFPIIDLRIDLDSRSSIRLLTVDS